MALTRLVLGFALVVFLRASASDPLTQESSFLGGGGNTATNQDYIHIGTWGHQVQTSVSSGGQYVNYSGFLAATTPVGTNPLRILAFGYQSQPAFFFLTITTLPAWTHSILFADALGATNTWQRFQNSNTGTYYETNVSPSLFTFTDDFSTNTSGGSPNNNQRFYRIQSNPP